MVIDIILRYGIKILWVYDYIRPYLKNTVEQEQGFTYFF